MGYASLAMQAAGAVSSGVGSYYSAKSAKINAQGQADLAEINARIAESGAQSTLLTGQQQSAALTLRAGQLKSSQRASMAANGIDLGTGSAAEVLASTEVMKEIDKNTIEANAVRSAWGYRTQAVNLQNEARVRRVTADGINPGQAAATSLIGDAGKVASSWYSMNKSGALDAPSDVIGANKSSDPIYTLGESRRWFEKG